MRWLARRLLRALLNRAADVVEWRLPDWNADAAWRYLPIARAVERELGPEGTILDVGAGGVGIAAYTRNACVLTDVREPVAARAAFVLADGASLPFRDRSFDAVVSADVLEHLPRDARPAAVHEMFRVARRMVVVAVPSGPAAEEHDRRLLAEAHPESSLRHFLGEHVANGLPSAEELIRWMDEAASGHFAHPALECVPNASIAWRYRMMRGIVRADEWGAVIRLRLWTALSRPLSRLSSGECYRVIAFCVDRAGGVRE